MQKIFINKDEIRAHDLVVEDELLPRGTVAISVESPDLLIGRADFLGLFGQKRQLVGHQHVFEVV